jgi:hypothetical protein
MIALIKILMRRIQQFYFKSESWMRLASFVISCPSHKWDGKGYLSIQQPPVSEALSFAVCFS